MGRLDDRAKRRIVELRRAGLSFRKIKKVLELDDIRVTPQAVYLFLKRRSVEPGPAAAGWDSDQPWPPLQGHAPEPSKAVPSTGPTGSQVPCPAASQDTKMGIQIVSVVSLCQDGRQPKEVLPMRVPPGNGTNDSTGTSSAPGSCPNPGGPTTLLHSLPSQGQLVPPPLQEPSPDGEGEDGGQDCPLAEKGQRRQRSNCPAQCHQSWK
ncbi:uncharacterized protein LOC135180694 [Pogoniulus pusillus]|uniref:uncharacterized protein LOC135180694 n=1 Tax=Pogoniulus pusillus TaxID=488313 RepID=UPI0030B9542D